jgi:hypothetical protein
MKVGHIAMLLSVSQFFCQSIHQQFLFIFFTEVAHTEMKFGIQIDHKNDENEICFSYNRAIFDRVMTLGL